MKVQAINPSGIEETLVELPSVAIACVVGVQEQRGEDLPRAYIVRDLHATIPVDEKAVPAFMELKMSDDHRLTGEIEFVDREWLPYSGNGKVLRKEVQKTAQEGFDTDRAILEGVGGIAANLANDKGRNFLI